MYRLPLAHPAFDAVTIHQVLHFADDPGAAIAEAARVLRPGGRLVIVDFAPHTLDHLRHEHAHRRLGFADDEIVELGARRRPHLRARRPPARRPADRHALACAKRPGARDAPAAA